MTTFLAPPDLEHGGFLPAKRTITIDSFRADKAAKAEAFDNLYAATRDVQVYRDNFNSEEMAVAEAYDRRNAAIFEATGTQLANPLKQARGLTGGEMGLGEVELDFSTGAARFDPFGDWDRKIDELTRQYPAQMQLINPRSVREDAYAIAQEAEAGAGQASADAGIITGPRRFGAALGGAFAGMTRDPLQVASFFIGGAAGKGKTVMARVMQAMLTEAAINTGIEGAVQVASNKWKREAGLDASVETALTQVGLAAAFGGGIGGLVQGGREVFKAAGKAVPENLLTRAADGDAQAIGEIAELAGVPLDAETRRIVAIAAEQEGLDRASFGAALDAGPDAARVAERTIAAIESDLPLPAELRGPETVPEMGPDNFRFFDPARLEVDAARFQFKAGGDEAGVTERLRGVGEWQPERAGVIVVFEDAGGRQFVADGHQRAGLARRVSEASGEQIELPGYVFRASDGFTAEDVRTIAALKNIAEGSGSSVDAAKVLRTGDAGNMSLPPNSALVRDAAGLARLSDDAFTMAVNEVIDPKLAAVVGRMISNDKIHAQILGVLKSEGAKTIGDAESMVRDLMSQAVVIERQDSLFGAEEVSRMLLKERAAVRASALNTLKKDKQVFAMLAEEEARVASAGNIVDTAANLERATSDARLIEIIEKLANRSGPVGDAFNAAARAVAGGKSARSAAGLFVDAVRSEIERAGGDLGAIGRSGSDPEIIPPSALAPARPMEPATTEAADLADLALVEARGPSAADLEAEGQASMFSEAPALAESRRDAFVAVKQKALDDTSLPEFAFHGTSRGEFEFFDPYSGNYGLMGSGSYFTENPMIASEYSTKGKGAAPFLYKAKLKIANPIEMEASANIEDWTKAFPNEVDPADFSGRAPTNEDLYRYVEDVVAEDEMLPAYEGAEIMQEGLRSMGYDGITHVGGGRHKASKGEKHRVWIAFDPDQIAIVDRISAADFAAREAPTSSEATPSGQQSLIPGVEPVTDRVRADLAAARPMRGGDAAPPAGGLFDADARGQMDIADLIPAGTDAEGRPLYTTHADLVAEASRDNDLADLIASCKD